jgi:predicted secreted protein
MTNGSTKVTGLKVVKFFVWLVYGLASAAIIVLAFAFFLLMFDANSGNAFAEFIAKWGEIFAKPFAGLITPSPLASGGVIAWSLLVAIAAYAILAWLVGMILDTVSSRIYRDTHGRVVGEQTVTRTHQEAGGDVVQTTTAAPIVSAPPVEAESAEPVAVPEPGAGEDAVAETDAEQDQP